MDEQTKEMSSNRWLRKEIKVLKRKVDEQEEEHSCHTKERKLMRKRRNNLKKRSDAEETESFS